jgi:uncharacterized protein
MDTINTNSTLRNLLTALLVILIAFVAIKTISEIRSMSYIGKAINVPNVITVSGKGEILTTPDIATFSFGVSEEALIVADAQAQVEKKMSAILDYLKKSGVEDKDVKTISYDIYPRYDYRNGTYNTPGKQILAGYVVTQSVEIKVRKLEEAGKLLSGIGEFGATNASGLNFTLDNYDATVREARDKAIKDAREQALKLAESLGVKLGSITTFYDNSGYPGPVYYAKDALGMGGAPANQAASLPTGESKIVSNVTITYEIK